MSRRLIDLYPLGSLVQVYFPQIDLWLTGAIVDHAHPAVWVQTTDGRRWFVTNSRKIRPMPTTLSGESPL